MAIKKRFRKYINKHPRLECFLLNVINSSFFEKTFWHKAWMNDRKYIEKQYFEQFGVKPNLDNPKSFNEKNNWRKLNERNPMYTDMVDKYKIKSVIAERLAPEYTFPLIGVWNNPNEINFESLPSQFVLKINHGGGIIACRDKATFDYKSAVIELKKSLKRDCFIPSREWPYKNVKRKIIAEQYMGEDLIDFKNYCFNGKLEYTLIWKNKSREDGRKPQAFFCGSYDREWKKTDMELDYPSLHNEVVPKPDCYEELVRVCEKMSKNIPFVRVDCYIINNRVYVGEMTFFPWGGYQKFKDKKWDYKLGELEVLSSTK